VPRQSSQSCVHQSRPSSAQTYKDVSCRSLRETLTLQSCSTIGRKDQETEAATNLPIAEMLFDQRNVLEITGALLGESIGADISEVILHSHHTSPARSQHLVSLPFPLPIFTGCLDSSPCYSPYLHQVSLALPFTLYRLNPAL